MVCEKRCGVDCPLVVIGPGSNNYGRGWGSEIDEKEILRKIKKRMIQIESEKIYCDACGEDTGRIKNEWTDSIVCPKCHHRVR